MLQESSFSNSHKSTSDKDGATPEEILGRIIRERRLELGLTEADLEREGKPKELHIHAVETGSYQVCLRDLLYLARLLKMSSAELMEEVERRMSRQTS